MHLRFDTLFKISVWLENSQTTPPELRPAKGLELVLSEQTRQLFDRYGLIWVAGQQEYQVVTEKFVDPDGIATVRHKPMPNMAFTFLLQLRDPNIANTIEPFVKRPALGANLQAVVLPNLAGRSKIFYFDNLDATLKAENDLSLSTEAHVSLKDLGGRLPSKAKFPKGFPAISSLKLRPLVPNGAPDVIFNLNTQMPWAELSVPEGAYQATTSPPTIEQVLLISDRTEVSTAFGIVHFFKGPDKGWEDAPPAAEYKIVFSQA